MPLRGPGFNQPVTTAVLSVAAVAYMLWILFAEDTEKTEKKSEKKTEDVPRPREPRTILLPKLSLRDFRNDEYLYGEEGEYETIVLEEWVDKYDGPSSAYSRRPFPTESHSWPTVAPPYRPAVPQPRSRKPDRRPPGKCGPSAIGSNCSIFGDGDLFSAIRGMGDFDREKPAAATIVHRGESAEFLRLVRAAKIKVEVGNISRHSKENEDEILKRAVKVQEDGANSLNSEETDEVYWDSPGFQEKFLIKRAEDKIGTDSRHFEEGSIYVYVNGPWLPLWRVEYNEFYNPNPPAWLAEDVEDGDPFFDALDVPMQLVHSEKGSIYVNGPWLPLWRVDYDEFYNPNPPAWLAEDAEDEEPFFDANPPAWLAEDTGDEEPFFDALDVPVQFVPQYAVKGRQLGPVQELERPHQLLMALIMFVMTEYFVSFQILMSSVTESLVDAMKSAFAVIRIYYEKIKQLILPFIPSVVKNFIISVSGRTWKMLTSVAEMLGGAMNMALSVVQSHSDKFQLVVNRTKQLLQPLVPYVMMLKDSMVSMVGSARMMMASLGGAMNRALLLLSYDRFQAVVLLSYDRFQVVVSKIKQLLNALIPPVIQECMVSFYGSIRIRITSVAELLAGAMNRASPFVIKFKECILSIFGCIWILMISMIELLAGAMHRTMLVLHYAITDLMYPRLKQLVLAFIASVIKFKECILSIYGYARILIIKLVETLWGAVKRLLRVLHYVGYDLMYTSVKRLVLAFIASVIRLKDRIISCILFILIIIYLTRRAYQHRNQLRHRMN
ncbi:uncharacterized protein LOC118409037 [Branchiostoma floridae]|uniref:Uncharacterized protein LOC118409037 n=1 Tax=Branchiostoma floridae TaxID=7739 RepID=C3YQS2_BRAFL|nr:uncharacterized protein LOC118409037 [Branchiostoma floridae]|eukprot:XP_002601416.1 hypothetical protein BRAFLDRAFT_122822 [Branchiostoma floridae]